MHRLTLLFLLLATHAHAQPTLHFAGSIRKTSNIPELVYAVLSADSVYEMQALGVRKANTNLTANLTDRFRIGSNTKAVTGMLAAILVQQDKLSWDTKFFDLFPEMKARSRKEYHDVTLLQLLSFRTRLIKYTYTDAQPTKGQFSGNEEQQRHQFAQWVLQQPPVQPANEISFSNPGYILAGLMLEKASGKPYKQQVKELGQQLDIDFHFGQPNVEDTLQPWGHTTNLAPEAPADNYKLNWLLPAGNISLSLPHYAKFIQLQLQGLQGKSTLLSRQEFEFLHYGLPTFAVGWFWQNDENGRLVSFSTGNPGSFLAKVFVHKNENKAFIILSNAQTDAADEGMNALYTELCRQYL